MCQKNGDRFLSIAIIKSNLNYFKRILQQEHKNTLSFCLHKLHQHDVLLARIYFHSNNLKEKQLFS